jgi:ATP-dependent Lon protease
MAETQIIERTPTSTTIRTGGGNGQRTVLPSVIPVLPIRNIVVFPGTVMPLNVGRAKSKALLDEVMPGDKLIGVVTQRNADVEDPRFEDLHHVGVACMILKLFKLPDGNQSIIVHGLARFRLLELSQTDPFATGGIEVLEDIVQPGPSLDALVNSVRQQANRVIELSPNTPDEAAQVLNSITNPSALADFLAANLPTERGDVAEKQMMLEELDVEKRLRMIATKLAAQLDVLELQNKIQSQVKENIDKSQRRYYLQEQMKAIRKELGESEGGGGGEVDQLRQKLEAARLPENVMKEAERELSRLEAIPSASPEYGVIRTWLQIVSELPWSVTTTDKIDLADARRVLDRDHHDLDKVKRRIIEYLAVLKLKRRQIAAKLGPKRPKVGEVAVAEAERGPENAEVGPNDQGRTAANPRESAEPVDPNHLGNVGEENVGGAGAILCFLGPPGVGKTSLGKSIAEAMGRKFIRVALGGVRDEADIRGHRRTYIGSMPGRIIAELRKAGTRNPVMMLDEIDKLGADFRGDPASALLEVLDPAQNYTFTDHYLDVPFDLSQVLFIATANTADTIPGPLRDRMEVIEIPGYTESDKLNIAKRYLVPRQLEANGLEPRQVRFKDEALRWIIEGYTREAGVRSLERSIGSVARAIAAEVVGRADDAAAAARGGNGKGRGRGNGGGNPGGGGSAAPTSAAPANVAAMVAAREVENAQPGQGDEPAGGGPARKPNEVRFTVDRDYVTKVLGPRRFEPELAQRTSVPGVATGLAYTPVGGEILFIEATRMAGKGSIILTGQIGDVMKESATAAFSLIRSRAESLGIDPKQLAESDIHIHVPAGAIPKDGPSAGTAMFTALASLLLNRPVRPDVAMTGEITLRGLVLPIGGLKEKTLAAKRAGIKEVIVPKRNEKDLPDIPDEVRQTLKFHFVENVDQVMDVALGAPKGGAGKATARADPGTATEAPAKRRKRPGSPDDRSRPKQRPENGRTRTGKTATAAATRRR